MDKKFSSSFYRLNERIEKNIEEYNNAHDDKTRARIEFITLLETHIDHFKQRFSKHNNNEKRDDLFVYIENRLSYDVPHWLRQDKVISQYLTKNGFLTETTFNIIDSVIGLLISSIVLICAKSFFDLQIDELFFTVGLILTVLFIFTVDITLTVNYYRVK